MNDFSVVLYQNQKFGNRRDNIIQISCVISDQPLQEPVNLKIYQGNKVVNKQQLFLTEYKSSSPFDFFEIKLIRDEDTFIEHDCQVPLIFQGIYQDKPQSQSNPNSLPHININQNSKPQKKTQQTYQTSQQNQNNISQYNNNNNNNVTFPKVQTQKKYTVEYVEVQNQENEVEEEKKEERKQEELNEGIKSNIGDKIQQQNNDSFFVFRIGDIDFRIHLNSKYPYNEVLKQIKEQKNMLENLLEQKLKTSRKMKNSPIKYYDFSVLEYILIAHHNKCEKELDKNFCEKRSIHFEDRCCICLEDYYEDLDKLTIQDIVSNLSQNVSGQIVRLEKCSDHYMHLECITNMMQNKQFIKCPVCMNIYGIYIGDQPEGRMNVSFVKNMRCEGFPQSGAIVIQYYFPSGNIKGVSYHGTSRTAYLPDNPEGREILELFKVAFDRKLMFIIGTSVTTGQQNCVVWSGIHHKTSLSGGTSNYGYPDNTYFKRVKEELAARGVTTESIKLLTSQDQ